MPYCPRTGTFCCDDMCYSGSVTLCGYDLGAELIKDMLDDEPAEPEPRPLAGADKEKL